VLIVEDEPAQRRVFALVVKNLGHEPVECATMAEARAVEACEDLDRAVRTFAHVDTPEDVERPIVAPAAAPAAVPAAAGQAGGA